MSSALANNLPVRFQQRLKQCKPAMPDSYGLAVPQERPPLRVEDEGAKGEPLIRHEHETSSACDVSIAQLPSSSQP